MNKVFLLARYRILRVIKFNLSKIYRSTTILVAVRKHNKIKIDSFEIILLFFLSADAKASPKERKSNRSKASS